MKFELILNGWNLEGSNQNHWNLTFKMGEMRRVSMESRVKFDILMGVILCGSGEYLRGCVHLMCTPTNFGRLRYCVATAVFEKILQNWDGFLINLYEFKFNFEWIGYLLWKFADPWEGYFNKYVWKNWIFLNNLFNSNLNILEFISLFPSTLTLLVRIWELWELWVHWK